jgi:hypothetical protein
MMPQGLRGIKRMRKWEKLVIQRTFLKIGIGFEMMVVPVGQFGG